MGLKDRLLGMAADKAGLTTEQVMAQAQQDAPVVDALMKIRELLEKQGGGFGISCMKREEADNDTWVASLEWGKEAPDSDMVAAAAYSQGNTFNDAVLEVAKEARLVAR
jgi:hypothetical protein